MIKSRCYPLFFLLKIANFLTPPPLVILTWVKLNFVGLNLKQSSTAGLGHRRYMPRRGYARRNHGRGGRYTKFYFDKNIFRILPKSLILKPQNINIARFNWSLTYENMNNIVQKKRYKKKMHKIYITNFVNS